MARVWITFGPERVLTDEFENVVDAMEKISASRWISLQPAGVKAPSYWVQTATITSVRAARRLALTVARRRQEV
jgi:hypothetical protein